jgi:gliding motility-associated protein GldM
MSGASNCPETPRQKMIGVMYLVLTAMLALNVAKTVLDGYSMVDDSLHDSINSSITRNKSMYESFEELAKKNPAKVKEWLEKAQEVKKKSDEMFTYIETFKKNMIKLVDKELANDSAYARQIDGKDNYDVPGLYAILQGNGKIFEEKLVEHKKFLIGLSQNDKSKCQLYEKMFATEKDKSGRNWDERTFEHMPIAAAVAVCTKYQADIRSAEAELVQYLKAQTDAADFRVNKITALVVPNSKYIIKGGKYTAQIVLSAVDSTQRPEFLVSGSVVPNGLYEMSCGKSGAFKYEGMIKLPGNDGVLRTYPFQSDYIVGEPSATISNEDLKVVYRGIDNNFGISVPGVADENISIKIIGGTSQKVAGKYIIKATQDEDITINVFAKIDGKDLQMGGSKYRVKYLPDPKSFLQYTDGGGVVRQVQDGSLSKRILKGNTVSLIAGYGPDELMKANFNVTSFSMVTIFGSVNVNGSKFTPKQLSDIDKLEGGDLVTLKNIKAVGPDGKVRSLGLIQIQI